MGMAYGCKCENCGYKFGTWIDVGRGYPMVYRDVVKKMKAGEYGDQGKTFFEDAPDGAIDCRLIVAQCTSCGAYFGRERLDMYIPKDDCTLPEDENERIWNVKDYYELYDKYEHKCPHCGAKAEIVEDFEKKLFADDLKCGKCGSTMKIDDFAWWD